MKELSCCQGQKGTAKGYVKPANGEEDTHCDVNMPRTKYGESLPSMISIAVSGVEMNCSIRSALPLARNGQRCKKRTNDRHDQRKHTGNNKRAALKIFVVPRPRLTLSGGTIDLPRG